ncbi:hypothetical protein [Corynebacterium halotolerans]
MGQEQFVGKEHFEEFDPERFAEQIKREAAERKAESSDEEEEQ